MNLARGRGRGRGRGRARGPPPPEPALVVVVSLDDTLRGLVIGARGATVQATQRETKARVQAPKRGEAGPTTVSGPDVLSVLRACCLIGRQTSASSACTCALASSTELRATLHPTDASRHVLRDRRRRPGGRRLWLCLPLRARRARRPTTSPPCSTTGLQRGRAEPGGVGDACAQPATTRRTTRWHLWRGPNTHGVAIYARRAALAGAGGGGATIGPGRRPRPRQTSSPRAAGSRPRQPGSQRWPPETGRLDEAAEAMKTYFAQVQGPDGHGSN